MSDNTEPGKSDASRTPMPFEPVSNRKQAEKKRPAAPVKAQLPKATRSRQQDSTAIPEVVSQRMIRRMAIFCGIPTLLGMSTFGLSYWVVSQNIFPLPHSATVLVSMGWFGLGVLGLSYGVLSASWDEAPGSRLGWSEFTTNWGRMTSAWRSNKPSSPEQD